MNGELIDVGLAKALNNPMRQAILRRLRSAGEQTATSLAEHLGVTTGATSYNLRILADHGLVEDAERPGSGKRRWWRAVPRDLRLPQDRGPELDAELDSLTEAWLRQDIADLTRHLEHRPSLGEWADLPFSRGTLRATPERLMAFFTDYLELMKRHQREAEAAGEEGLAVQIRFLTFLDPDEEPAG